MENYYKKIVILALILNVNLFGSNLKAINRVLSHEGTQIVNNKTEYSKYGVTDKYLIKYNLINKTNYSVSKLTYLEAQYIVEHILERNRINEIKNQKLKEHILDVVYNTGPKGIYFIQRSINEFSESHKLGISIKEDGVIGSETINAINQIKNQKALNQLIYKNRIIYYQSLPNWNTYSKGWTKRIESFK
ncbi:MAG: putative peptidoglycan-binding domain-containing protein [Cetobacterium sp.]